MTKQQVLDYCKEISFGLKDFDKTAGKYKNYRKSITVPFENDYLDSLERYIFDVRQSYTGWIYSIKMNIQKDGFTRSQLRQLKTAVNNATYEMNKRYIERYLDEGTYAKNHKFTERYYLDYYSKINTAMKKVYIELIRDIL